jgi:hypothetical protein
MTEATSVQNLRESHRYFASEITRTIGGSIPSQQGWFRSSSQALSKLPQTLHVTCDYLEQRCWDLLGTNIALQADDIQRILQILQKEIL